MSEIALEQEKKTKKKLKTTDIVFIGIFAAIIAVCSWISIPLAVPITLQTMGVCIAAGLLGAKKGSICVLIYMLLGIIGLPVFSGFSSGLGQLLGPTGGYIIGFIFTALIVGGFTHIFGKKAWALFVSMILGIAVCYAFGTAWFMVVYSRNNETAISLSAALGMCVVPFIIPDIVKAGVAAFICSSLKKYVK